MPNRSPSTSRMMPRMITGFSIVLTTRRHRPSTFSEHGTINCRAFCDDMQALAVAAGAGGHGSGDRRPFLAMINRSSEGLRTGATTWPFTVTDSYALEADSTPLVYVINNATAGRWLLEGRRVSAGLSAGAARAGRAGRGASPAPPRTR